MFTRFRRAALVTAIVVVLVVVAAGCGSSNSSSSSASSATAAANATSTTGASPTGAVASARLAVAKLEQGPTAIPATTPLPERPVRGKTIVALLCQVPQCALFNGSTKAAASAVGWNVKDIPYDETNPATLITALNRALAMKPVAVTGVGAVPQQIWASEIPAFTKAHIALIPAFIGPAKLSSTVPVNLVGPANDALTARGISQWLIADSNGKANVLIQSISAFASVPGWVKDIQNFLKSNCPECRTSTIDNSGAQVDSGATTAAVISQLRSDPSIDYVVADGGSFIPGLAAAIKNAGLKVKIAGANPLPQNVTDVMAGQEGAWMAANITYVGWISLDAALRYQEGAPALPESQTVLPQKLVTKQSALRSDGNFSGPANYPAQFLKLWKLG